MPETGDKAQTAPGCGKEKSPPTAPPPAPRRAWTIRGAGSSSKNHLEQEELYPGEVFPETSLSDSTLSVFIYFSTKKTQVISINRLLSAVKGDIP